MVQQVVVPQAVVEVADEAPRKHDDHAKEKLAVLERDGEDLLELQTGCFRVGVFLRHRLHPDVDEDEHEREVAEQEDELILHRGALHGVGEKAADEEHNARQDGRKRLVEGDIARPAFALLRVEAVEPRRKAGTKQRVDGIREEQDDDEPRQARVRIGDELWHNGRRDDVHGVEVNFRGEQDPFALLEPAEDRG